MRPFALVSISLLTLRPLGAWGVRGHTVANLAAVEGIPQDGPVFLKLQEAYIGHLGTIPDTLALTRSISRKTRLIPDTILPPVRRPLRKPAFVRGGKAWNGMPPARRGQSNLLK